MSESALRRGLRYVLLTTLALLVLFPVLWIVLSSFKPQNELFRQPMTLLPQAFTLQNYSQALSQGDFLRYFGNSLFVAVTSTVLAVLFNVMAGYALAKYIFPGRGLLFGLMLSTLMIPAAEVLWHAQYAVGHHHPAGGYANGHLSGAAVHGNAAQLHD